MSIVDINKIDSIGTDKLTGEVILTVTDHLDWQDEEIHLQILQDKLNSYLDFIEGGQILEDYPISRERKVVIEIVSLYDFSENGKLFLIQVAEILKTLDVTIRQKKG